MTPPCQTFSSAHAHRRSALIALLAYFVFSCSSLRIFEEEFSDRVHKGELIEAGVASWYGPQFHNKRTANMEVYDMHALTAAHPTLPFNTVVRVKNLANGRTVRVRINDRGPYVKNRVIDLSKRAADQLDMIRDGTSQVEIHLVREGDTPVYREYVGDEIFTIQLGSFTNLSKARELSSRHEDATIVSRKIRGKTFFRVYYGKYALRSDAESALRQMQAQVLGLQAIVIQYQN